MNRQTAGPVPKPKRPQPKGGSRKGRPNRTTSVLKDAILLAAEQAGHDGKGKDGLTGYLRSLAVLEPVAFASLLGKVLPLQISGEGGGPVRIARVELIPMPAAAIERIE